MAYVKTAAEFKQIVTDIIRSMPLKEILFIPNSYVEGAITAWLEVNPDTGVSEAHREYLTYYHMLNSLPDDQMMLDTELYMFRVARRVVDGLMLTMLDTQYYKTIFDNADIIEDAKYFMELTNEIIDRVDQQIEQEHGFTKFISSQISKPTSQIREEFNNRYKEVMNENTDIG